MAVKGSCTVCVAFIQLMKVHALSPTEPFFHALKISSKQPPTEETYGLGDATDACVAEESDL